MVEQAPQKRFKLRDPHFKERVRDSFNRQGFMAGIGAQMDEVELGRCVVSVPFSDQVSQQHGFFHGGSIGAIADTAGAYAAFTLTEAEHSGLTIEYKINFLAPAKGQRLIAEANVIKAGRNISISHVDLYAIGDEARIHCATALLTMMLIDKPDQ